MAILHYLATAADGAPLRFFGMATKPSGPLTAVTANATHGLLGHPVQVASEPGELAIGVAVGAIADIPPRQASHEGAELEQACGRFSIAQNRGCNSWMRCKVRSTSLSPSSNRLSAPGPDHVEIAWRKLGHSQLQMSAQMVGLPLGSTSSEVTFQPGLI